MKFRQLTLLLSVLPILVLGSSVELDITPRTSESSDETIDLISATSGNPYIGIGLAPSVEVGYRYKDGRKGFDAGLTFLYAFGHGDRFQARALYLHYFSPKCTSQPYIGIGPEMTYCLKQYRSAKWCCGDKIFNIDYIEQSLYVSPTFVWGKEYLTKSCKKRFLQMKVNWPNYNATWEYMEWDPVVTLTWGFMF